MHFVAPKVRSFTIYKQKPVGARFVQMVNKNSRMGNLVGTAAHPGACNFHTASVKRRFHK